MAPRPLKPARRHQPANSDRDRFWIHGRRPVAEALNAGNVERLLFAEGSVGLKDLLHLAAGHGVPVEQISTRRLDSMTGGQVHQGVAALVDSPTTLELSALLALDQVPLLVVLDGVEDPHNLGAVIRSAEAAGATGVVIPQRRAAPLTPTAIKASAGAALHVPLAVVGSIGAAIRELKQAGLTTVGLDGEGPEALFGTDLRGPVALVLGSEGRGLGSRTRAECDLLVRIPMAGRVSSLNVSAAAAVVLFEVRRQRDSTRER